jgi:hypothetical protein
MEIKRRQFTLASTASRLLSAIESAGLASTATFASALWVGLALPGLPLLPGLGTGGNSNVAISLSSAVLGVQESQTFKSPNNPTGRQARLLSLLLPADALANDLATAPTRSAESRAKSLIVALPDPPAAEGHESGPSSSDQPERQVASAPVQQSQPAPQPPAPAPPAPHPATPAAAPRQQQPDPNPPAPGPSTPSTPPPSSDSGEPVVAPPPADGGEGPQPADPGAPESTESPDPAEDPGYGDPGGAGSTPGGNGNGNGNGNAGGNNPNAGGNNPNAGGNSPNAGGNNPNAGGNNPNAGGNGNGNGNAGGNNPNAGGANAGGNGNGNGAAKGGPKKGP